MVNAGGPLVCMHCRQVNAANATYCARCGEPIGPALVAELNRTYTTLLELDKQIADGHGADTVATLRDTLRDRYLGMRAAQLPVGGAIGQPAPVTRPIPQPVGAAPIPPTPVPAAMPTAPSPPLAQPHGPVFSWRAFIAEQAIAVMGYLGGFLLLVATLTFEVGGWQALPDGIKLVGVLIVYLVFGALGWFLRRSTSLRTVSRVYLAVFALMTPLAALAVYRFELQARGFSAPGMVCVSAFYAAVIYLMLAARTRFATYAYLGWGAALLGALAIPPFAAIDTAWEAFVGAVVALALLAPFLLMRLRPTAPDWLGVLALPALQLSGGVSILATLGALFLGLQAFDTSLITDERLAAFAATSCTLVVVALGWTAAFRRLARPIDDGILQVIDLSVAGTFTLATTAVAVWLHASHAAEAFTLIGTGLVEALAIEFAPRINRSRMTLRIGVQALAVALVGIAAVSVAPDGPTTLPSLTALAAGVALSLLFALRGPVSGAPLWGLVAGGFLLAEANFTLQRLVPANRLYANDDYLPGALLQMPTLLGMVTVALAGLSVALRRRLEDRRVVGLRFAALITTAASALYAWLWLPSHTSTYSALHLTVYALVALALTRIERIPVIGGIAVGLFGAAAAFTAIATNDNGWVAFAIPLALSVTTIVVSWLLGRAYGLPVYIVTLFATLLAFFVLRNTDFVSTGSVTFLGFGLAGWLALLVASALTVDALGLDSLFWMAGPSAVALLSVIDARDAWPVIALTVALVGVGLLIGALRHVGWSAPWHIAAAVASVVALVWSTTTPDAEWRTFGVALAFSLVAYFIAWRDRLPWVTAVVVPYGTLAVIVAGGLPMTSDQILIVTVAIALAFMLSGMAARRWLGRFWSLAPYALALIGVLISTDRVNPYPERAGLVEALLLGFAALAFFAALLEETPWAALAPAALAAFAALVQPDGRALLPLALGLAACAYAISRTREARWSLPFYGAALFAAIVTAWQGHNQAGVFELIALAVLALAAWAVAALESRPDALLVAFAFAALSVSSAAHAFAWEAWQVLTAYAALAWVFELSSLGWVRIPWLRERRPDWLVGFGRTAEAKAAWSDPRRAGKRISRAAAIFVSAGVVVAGYFADQTFATHASQTEALTAALFSLTALLAFIGWGERGWRPALYLAGETLALCVTWQLRWFGATNPQAWIIAPGSAQLIIGALLPADHRMRLPAWVPQGLTLAGTMILLLPTLAQSVTEPQDWQWVYALLLAAEALTLTLIAVGLRNRMLALTGAAFVGVAAIRGAIIAVQQNLPIPLVIGFFALLLMGLATWLSIRARRAAHLSTTKPADMP